MIRATLFLHKSVLTLFLLININHNMSLQQLISKKKKICEPKFMDGCKLLG